MPTLFSVSHYCVYHLCITIIPQDCSVLAGGDMLCTMLVTCKKLIIRIFFGTFLVMYLVKRSIHSVHCLLSSCSSLHRLQSSIRPGPASTITILPFSKPVGKVKFREMLSAMLGGTFL